MRKFVAFALLLLPLICFADNPPPPGLEDPVVAAPIDQIKGLLFFTAIFMGIYFIYSRGSKNNKVIR
ncbi:hypothetical protein [Flavobacterium sp. 2]|uniref:hypothetical protein n=1 Tax=Flavobacterium sp. 2 TaxID=308053 RepID=UPI003CEE544F